MARKACGPCYRRMGAITQAMAKAAVSYGVDIRLSTRCTGSLSKMGTPSALRRTKAKPSAPRPSPPGLIPSCSTSTSSMRSPCPRDFVGAWKLALRLGHVSYERCAFRIAGFHRFAGRALAEHHAAGIIIARALPIWSRPISTRGLLGGRAAYRGISHSSTLDDTLAPRGQHVASLFCQHVAPKLPDGSSWDEHRETVAVS